MYLNLNNLVSSWTNLEELIKFHNHSDKNLFLNKCNFLRLINLIKAVDKVII